MFGVHNHLISASFNQRQHQAGFTLLELMVAISIFAILGVGSYRLLSGEITTQTRLQAHSSQQHQWQRGLRKLQHDLLQVTARPIRTAYDDTEAAFVGSRESFTFTRRGWDNPLGLERSQLQRVRYQLGLSKAFEDHDNNSSSLANDDNQQQLLRYYWQVLDQAQDSEPREQRLIDSVTTLEIRYLDAEGQWHHEWPQDSGNLNTSTNDDSEQQPLPFHQSLPTAIEIRLQTEAQGEILRLLSLGDRPDPELNSSTTNTGDAS